MTILKNLLLGSVGAVMLTTGSAYAADAPSAPARTPVWACDITGFWELPGTDICFKVGGYARLDINITFDEFDGNTGGGFGAGGGPEEASDATFSTVRLARLASAGVASPQGTGDHVRLNAQQSRINFDARSNTEYGTVRAFIEGDFYGTGGNETISNSSALRLRHAFVQFGNLLAGQTWSTFMGLSGLADTLDFGGPGAVTFIRQAQLRWTQPLGNGVSLSVAIENPESMDVRTAALTTLVNDELPDFVARLNVNQSWGSVQLAGVVRELRASFVSGTAADASDDIGWAVSLSGRINVPVANGNDNIRFYGIYGDGGARYHFDGARMALANAGTEGQRERNALGAPIESWGVSLSYQHFWADNLRSSIVGSYSEIDNNTAALSADQATAAYLNLIWSPIPRVDMGVELMWTEQELLNGVSADMTRLQFAIRRSF